MRILLVLLFCVPIYSQILVRDLRLTDTLYNVSVADTLLDNKINYSDTTSSVAMQWELDGKLNKADTTSKWLPLGGGNLTGNLTTTGMVRQGSIYHVYGGFQDSAITLSVTPNVWAMVTNTWKNLWHGHEVVGFSFSNDTIIVANTGDYVGSISLTFAALTGKDYQIRIYNITQDDSTEYIGASATGVNNFANVHLPIYLECVAGDKFVLQMRNTTDTTDPIIRSSVFYIAYLHD